jgi:hypothetical protein
MMLFPVPSNVRMSRTQMTEMGEPEAPVEELPEEPEDWAEPEERPDEEQQRLLFEFTGTWGTRKRRTSAEALRLAKVKFGIIKWVKKSSHARTANSSDGRAPRPANDQPIVSGSTAWLALTWSCSRPGGFRNNYPLPELCVLGNAFSRMVSMCVKRGPGSGTCVPQTDGSRRMDRQNA